jgi:hypothetical protein
MDNIQAKKMSIKAQTYDVADILSKYGAWIAYVCIGLIGKFGWDIVARKQLSWWYVIGTGFMAVFVGFISSRWFIAHDPDMGAYIVPVATLVSRDILMFLRMLDWNKILSVVLNVKTKDTE